MGGKVAFRNIGGQAALFDAVEEFRPEPSLAYQQGVGGDGSGVIGEVREGGVDAVDMSSCQLSPLIISLSRLCSERTAAAELSVKVIGVLLQSLSALYCDGGT